MVEFTCEAIGMEQDELQDRVVRGLVERILGEDHDDPESHVHRRAFKEANEQVTRTVVETVERIASDHIYPMAEKLITEHVFQETNQWGETKGEPRTFIEYLEERANAYFGQHVNAKGKAYDEISSYDRNNWKAVGTRLAFMIDSCLAGQIKEALDKAVENVHMTLAEGLAETARRTLAKVAAASTVEVKTTGKK